MPEKKKTNTATNSKSNRTGEDIDMTVALEVTF